MRHEEIPEETSIIIIIFEFGSKQHWKQSQTPEPVTLGHPLTKGAGKHTEPAPF